MKLTWTCVPFAIALLAAVAFAQDVIPLPPSQASQYPEKQYFSKNWNTEVIANVSQPSMLLFKAAPGTSNGTAVIVVPGGGFMALSITSEGTEVAKWLAARGVTAFVLKYRIAHTGEDATQEFAVLHANQHKFNQAIKDIIPLAVADGLAAVAYIRQYATKFGVSQDRVGIVGFSAGGVVTSGVASKYSADNRPAFVAPIYAGNELLNEITVPSDAPPMFLAAATDDGLVPASVTIALYNKWFEAHRPAEMHIYARGGHGFGMKKQGLPSDSWIDALGEWTASQGWMKK